MRNSLYNTSDINIACAILSAHVGHLSEVKKEYGNPRAIFSIVLDQPEKIDKTIKEHLAGSLFVTTSDFSNSLKLLKSALYNKV